MLQVSDHAAVLAELATIEAMAVRRRRDPRQVATSPISSLYLLSYSPGPNYPAVVSSMTTPPTSGNIRPDSAVTIAVSFASWGGNAQNTARAV